MTRSEPRPTLRVGYVPGVTLTKWRRIWDERRLGRLEVAEVAESDQRGVLDRGEVDVCFVRLPIDRDGLHAIPLYEEVAVVMARKDHPLSLYDQVSLADLADEEVIDAEHPDAVDLVAGGAGVLFVPMSVARTHSRRDLVHRPISDGAPTQIALAWRVDQDHPGIEDFIGVVRGRTVNSTRGQPRPRPRGG